MDITDPQILWLIGALLAAGAVSGFAAGLLGIGGGAVMVPVLYYVFGALGFGEDVIMHCAVGTSSAVIILSSIRSVRSHNRYGAVNWEVLFPANMFKSWGLWIAIGSLFAAGYVARFISGPALTLLFGVLAALFALQFIFGRPNHALRQDLPSGPYIPIFGSLIGGLSALLGIGGGSITVTFMVLCSVPIKKAISTASGLGVFISIPATLGFIMSGWQVAGRPPYSLGYVNSLAWGLITLTALIFIPLGARMTHSLDQKKLVRIFGVFLLLVSVNMIRKALGS